MTSGRARSHVPSRRIVQCVLALIAPLALTACDRLSATSTSHVDALPLLVAEEEARIGDFDDPDVGFTRVGGADVDRDGNLYVMEGSVPEIRVYSPEGTLLRRIGRRGGGPGEFESPPRFGVQGDTVWTVETRPTRITLFDREGSVRSTGRTDGVAIPLPRAYGFVLPFVMRPDGRFIGHFGMITSNPNDPPAGVQPTDSIPVPVVVFDAGGDVADTVGWTGRPPPRMWRPPSEAGPRWEIIQVGGRPIMVPRAPPMTPWWEVLPDGRIVIETPPASSPDEGAILVTRLGVSGDTMYHRALHYTPARYSGADLDSIAARTARGESGAMVRPGGGAPPVPDNWEGIATTLRGAMRFPEFKQPLQYPRVQPDGSIWLRLADEERADATWIVLDPSGRQRGRLELPSDVRILWNRGDTVWAVDPDEFDVQWVVHYTLTADGN